MDETKIKSICIIAAALLVAYFSHKFFGKISLPARPPMGGEAIVLVDKVAKRNFSDRIEAIGTANANESVTITTTVTEKVAEILFSEGAAAKKGDVLVRLDSAEEQASLAAAKVSLAENQRELDRIKSLRSKQVVSEKELDTQQSLVEKSNAEVMEYQAKLNALHITAPFSGMLGLRKVSLGTLVSPGTSITTLDDIETIKVEFTIPETVLSEVKIGQKIEAKSPAWKNAAFPGAVSIIDSRVNTTTRAIMVQAKIPNPDLRLRSGMMLNIDLFCNPRTAIGIPEKALVAFGEKQYAFVTKDNASVEKREVSLGRRDAGWVEILSGLNEGETLIVDGVMNLNDGSKIKITDQDAPAAATNTASGK